MEQLTPDRIAQLGEEYCPKSRDGGTHCPDWYDGEPCHWCKTPEMTAEQKQVQGMEG